MVSSNLMQTPNDRVYRSDLYRTLDPSEKGAVSYFLGLTSAKLLAERYLRVPWLMHLDVYRNNITPTFWKGNKKKPDLVGLNTQQEWIVVEAKGRSDQLGGNDRATTFKKAKSQTRAIKTISGNYPILRAALACHFRGAEFCIEWEDPDDYADDAVDVPLTSEDVLREYYRPFIEMLADTEISTEDMEIEGQTYRALRIIDADVTVGVNTRILDIGQPQLTRLINAFGDIYYAPASLDAATTVGGDGILVRLGTSWDTDNMRRQPQDRE